MDLRGLGKIGPGRYIIAGGMAPGQQVSAKTYYLRDTTVATGMTARPGTADVAVYPNPFRQLATIRFPGLPRALLVPGHRLQWLECSRETDGEVNLPCPLEAIALLEEVGFRQAPLDLQH